MLFQTQSPALQGSRGGPAHAGVGLTSLRAGGAALRGNHGRRSDMAEAAQAAHLVLLLSLVGAQVTRSTGQSTQSDHCLLFSKMHLCPEILTRATKGPNMSRFTLPQTYPVSPYHKSERRHE